MTVACEGILHGLLDGVPNMLHLEEARDVGEDGHEEHGKKVVGEDLEGRNWQLITTQICRLSTIVLLNSNLTPRIRSLVGIIIRNRVPKENNTRY